MSREGFGSDRPGPENKEDDQATNYLATELVRRLESGAQLSPENIRSLQNLLQSQVSPQTGAEPAQRTNRRESNREVRSEQEITSTCSEFIKLCDDREILFDQARAWFEARGLDVQSIKGDGDYWHLISVGDSTPGSSRYVVPAMRRAMGQVPLKDYFTLVGRYNGLNPLGSSDILRFPKISSDGKVEELGLIDS